MNKNLKNKKKKKGFTLIELIIVIAIIAILAAVAIPKFGEVRKNANVKADIANAKQIQGAVVALIADDKIDIPTTARTILFDGTADASDSTGDEDEIKDYLQSVPTVKVKDTASTANFTISISTTGTVTALVNSVQVYPEPANTKTEKNNWYLSEYKAPGTPPANSGN